MKKYLQGMFNELYNGDSKLKSESQPDFPDAWLQVGPAFPLQFINSGTEPAYVQPELSPDGVHWAAEGHNLAADRFKLRWLGENIFRV